ncbi:hypothetical protein [Aquidulcibacter sp.]|jgi:hypothetical protein|uniref:hypothetical protein n=1 Tax=Aquidulcibacter sp. TaxID=2052990 RepID=UPI003BA61D22
MATVQKLLKFSLALVVVCASVVALDTVVFQMQLKETGSAICSENFSKPTWLSTRVSQKAYPGMALTPDLPTAMFFLPTETENGFQTTRNFELQHSAEGLVSSDYDRFAADKCQYFRIVKLNSSGDPENNDQRYVNYERVLTNYSGLFLFAGANRNQQELTASEFSIWRKRGFANTRFFDITVNKTGRSVGGITCGTYGFAVDHGTKDEFAGFRISKNGDASNSRSWAADYLVERYLLRAEICSFMLYTRYSAIWSPRPTYLSNSSILPTDNTTLNRMIWHYDLIQIRLNQIFNREIS